MTARGATLPERPEDPDNARGLLLGRVMVFARSYQPIVRGRERDRRGNQGQSPN